MLPFLLTEIPGMTFSFFSPSEDSLKGQICLDYHYCVVEGRKKEFSCTVKKKLPTQVVRRRCRLSWVTNIALVYEPKCGGKGVAGNLANEYSCAHGAQILI
jgi:hypothetical protein